MSHRVFKVLQVTSAHRTVTRCEWTGQEWRPVEVSPGTTSLTCADFETERNLLKIIGEFHRAYGYRARSHAFGPVDERGNHRYFRWTFEGRSSNGIRISDMIIAVLQPQD